MWYSQCVYIITESSDVCNECENTEKKSFCSTSSCGRGACCGAERQSPNAVILHLEPEQSIGESEQVLLPALAASLYKDGTLSLGAAAQLSKMGLSPFADHLSSLGVEIVGEDETTESEQGDLNRWLAP